MTRTLRYLLLFVLIILSGSSFAQGIAGRVLDEKKESMISAVVQVYQGGMLRGGNVTDYDGNYVIKPLEPGLYNVLVLYAGYDSMLSTNVVVTPGNNTTLNFDMKRKSSVLSTVIVTGYQVPLVNHDTKSTILTKKEIDVLPTTNVNNMVALSTNAYQRQNGGAVNLSGARSDGTLYVIDGVMVRGQTGVNMAQGSIAQVEVITSGIPANYGDVSGGVVNITSRGVSQKLTGNIRLQHSIDGYNNNLATFSVAGPLYKKKMKNGEKKPILGFALSADYYYDNERNPSYERQYVTKGDVLNKLKQNPMRIVTDNSGQPVYNYAADYVTQSDFTKAKITPGNLLKEYRVNGKLDLQVAENLHLTGGGNFGYTSQDAYSRARNLFNPEATPVVNTYTGRAFLRFTQKFGKANDTSSKSSIISNAFYKLQIDYQKTYQDQHDPVFKEDFFKYAYIGKFEQTRTDLYFLQPDSLSKRNATILTLSLPGPVTFDRSATLNPGLANYTSQYYNSLGNNLPTSTNQIQASNALVNGDEPRSIYGLFTGVGSTQTFYTRFNSNQYALQVDASFDLQAGKTKHAIEFGLYYQQRIERQFVGQPNNGTSIWQQMRQLVSSVNNGNLRYDKQHPIFRVNGANYNYIPNADDPTKGYFTDMNGNVKNIIPGTTDTILYNYKNVGTSTFDKNLRKKLFAGQSDMMTRDINIDAYGPSTYSLDMFSADELINSGRNFVNYYGYTYTGKAQSGNVNFNDYWTQKDANGNYTRPIGAFSPNYIAGYIMDKFTYRDVHFNIGVRVDRYSANQKVLIDPYSLYAEKNVSQVSGTANIVNGGKHPGNMGAGYIVYVDDNNSTSPSVIGYRSGNNWYDPTGKFITDPSVLKQYSGGRDPQPALVKDAQGLTPRITDTSFNPNTSFTDYTPQVNVQPRISFSFPISDVADFYAHYDIYAQRPTSNSRADPSVYYFLQQNANQIINNPNLKPQKTFDYEVGFQQKLTERSAVTITAFYKERKDMITVVPVLYAWPSSYFTYGNRDFSTTKGTSVKYDMRATNHLRMIVSYTLQFAEGTGSDPSSSNRGGGGQISPAGLLNSFVNAGVPNLRYVTNLNIDSRHNIAANLDYRFGNGEGPMVRGLKAFQNAGANFVLRARSGEPYTRYTDAQGNTVIGGVNTSRLPWHYGIDLRINKDFALNNLSRNSNSTQGVKPKRPLYLTAIIMVNNLLQTREILGVYGYTGRPDDNGYLTSAYGHQFVPQQINPQSYTDMYRIAINNPGNLNYARTVSFALEFNF